MQKIANHWVKIYINITSDSNTPSFLRLRLTNWSNDHFLVKVAGLEMVRKTRAPITWLPRARRGGSRFVTVSVSISGGLGSGR